jgi:DnaJ-class molecular chaperone
MPILNNNPLGPIKKDYGRGNLILKFDIQFPQQLGEDKKSALIDVLNEIDEQNMEEMMM